MAISGDAATVRILLLGFGHGELAGVSRAQDPQLDARPPESPYHRAERDSVAEAVVRLVARAVLQAGKVVRNTGSTAPPKAGLWTHDLSRDDTSSVPYKKRYGSDSLRLTAQRNRLKARTGQLTHQLLDPDGGGTLPVSGHVDVQM